MLELMTATDWLFHIVHYYCTLNLSLGINCPLYAKKQNIACVHLDRVNPDAELQEKLQAVATLG